eukprot:233641_1
MLLLLLFLFCVSNTLAVIWKPNNTTASTNKIVVYWGQDAAGNYIEKNLASYCAMKQYDVFIIAFMIMFIDPRQPNCGVPNGPDLNFANHQNDCTTFPNCPFLLNCQSTIGVDIAKCQSMGKKILLSAGGAVGSYGFTSNSQGTQFAETVWEMFFEGTQKNGIRPFGANVTLDGIDLDIEGGSSVGYGSFYDALHSKMKASKKEYILTGAPQCVYPDAYLGPGNGKALTTAATDFSWLNVQFYNNYCGAYQPSYFWPAFQSWDKTAEANGYQILVGLPATRNAGGGAISASQACKLLPQLKTYKSFGGFMIWDTSWDSTDNYALSKGLRSCMG